MPSLGLGLSIAKPAFCGESGASTPPTAAVNSSFTGTQSVCLIGDSITQQTGTELKTALQAAFPNASSITVINKGQGGATSANWIAGTTFLNDAISSINTNSCGLVFIQLGTNDPLASISDATHTANIQSTVSTILAGCPSVNIIVLNEVPYIVPGVGGGGLATSAWNTSYRAYYASYSTITGTGVVVGATGLNFTYQFFQRNYAVYLDVDGTHPTPAGRAELYYTWITGAATYLAIVPGSINSLQFFQLPSFAGAGSPFLQQPIVRALDASGYVATGFTSNVVMSKHNGTGTLSGTTTVAAVAGITTYTNLQIDTAGAFSLTATSGGFHVDSSSFTIGTWINLVADPTTGVSNLGSEPLIGHGATLTLPAGTYAALRVYNSLGATIHGLKLWAALASNGVKVAQCATITSGGGANKYVAAATLTNWTSAGADYLIGFVGEVEDDYTWVYSGSGAGIFNVDSSPSAYANAPYDPYTGTGFSGLGFAVSALKIS